MFKKIIFTLCVAAASIFTIISCSKEDIYSCDPEINRWTKSNLPAISKMTRSNWMAVGNLARQRAIFNAFTPEQKLNLWVGKMQEALELDWSADERAHIEAVLTFMNENPDYFDNDVKKTEAEEDNYELFFYTWKDYAKTTLGWNDKLIYGIIYTPEKIADKEGNLAFVAVAANMVVSEREGGGTVRFCDCNTNEDNKYKCPIACNAGTCTAARGCGPLWQHTCSALCS